MDQERTEAVRQCEGLIRNLAHAHATRLCPAEDLEQEGRLAVWDAWLRYDHRVGVLWSTYAHACAYGAMRHYKRDRGDIVALSGWVQERYSRRGEMPPCTEQLPERLEASVRAAGDQAAEAIRRMDLNAALATCTYMQEACVRAFYWQQMTYEEAGQLLGVTSAAVQALLKRARRRIRRYLAGEENAA